jgi:hypothetical protein
VNGGRVGRGPGLIGAIHLWLHKSCIVARHRVLEIVGIRVFRCDSFTSYLFLTLQHPLSRMLPTLPRRV